jgi:hypothetical protein
MDGTGSATPRVTAGTPPGGAHISPTPWQPRYPVIHSAAANANNNNTGTPTGITIIPSTPTPLGPAVGANGEGGRSDSVVSASSVSSSVSYNNDGNLVSPLDRNFHSVHAHVLHTPVNSSTIV